MSFNMHKSLNLFLIIFLVITVISFFIWFKVRKYRKQSFKNKSKNDPNEAEMQTIELIENSEQETTKISTKPKPKISDSRVIVTLK